MQAAEPFRRGYIQQVLTSGSMIAGYRIERVLGEGQMGERYFWLGAPTSRDTSR